MKKRRWFHSSPSRLRIGTLLTGGHKPNYKGSAEDEVYITTDEIPHFTIAEDIIKAKTAWHVYEVIPNGKIHLGMWDDGMVASATVIRYIGNAKGILNRLRRHTNPRKPKEGSFVKLQTNSENTARWNMLTRIWQRRNELTNTQK